MKIKVTKEFCDKFDRTIIYRVGDVREFSDEERARNIVDLGYGEIVDKGRRRRKTETAEEPEQEPGRPRKSSQDD